MIINHRAMDIDASCQLYRAWQKWKSAWHFDSSPARGGQLGFVRRSKSVTARFSPVYTDYVFSQERVLILASSTCLLGSSITGLSRSLTTNYINFLHPDPPKKMDCASVTPVHQREMTAGVQEGWCLKIWTVLEFVGPGLFHLTSPAAIW